MTSARFASAYGPAGACPQLQAALSLELDGRSVVLPLVLGLSDDELAQHHPLVASKLYRLVESYDPRMPLAVDLIDTLVNELEDRLKSSASRRR